MLVSKSNEIFTPLAVAVCLIFVDCCGDFLFSLGFGFLLDANRPDSSLGSCKQGQLFRSFAVGSLCTAGGAASNKTASSSKVGRFFHELTRPQVIQRASRFSSSVCSRKFSFQRPSGSSQPERHSREYRYNSSCHLRPLPRRFLRCPPPEWSDKTEPGFDFVWPMPKTLLRFPRYNRFLGIFLDCRLFRLTGLIVEPSNPTHSFVLIHIFKGTGLLLHPAGQKGIPDKMMGIGQKICPLCGIVSPETVQHGKHTSHFVVQKRSGS